MCCTGGTDVAARANQRAAVRGVAARAEVQGASGDTKHDAEEVRRHLQEHRAPQVSIESRGGAPRLR